MIAHFLLRRNKDVVGFVLLIFVLASFMFFLNYKENEASQFFGSSMTVENQQILENEILLRKVVLDRPGHIMIHHADENDGIGDMIGSSSLLEAGSYEDISIGITQMHGHKNHRLLAIIHFGDIDKINELTKDHAMENSDDLVLANIFTVIIIDNVVH